MSIEPFVITGCGRSGTMGMAQLLGSLGVRVSFEEFFSARPFMENDVIRFPEWLEMTETVGEISGLALPYLKWLPKHVGVFHQVRNPVAVIASLMGLRNLHPQSRWLTNIKFNFRHLPDLLPDDDPLTLCMKYWLGWNALIEPYARCRYRAEVIRSPDRFANLLMRLGIDADENRIADVLQDHPPDFNTQPRDTSISWRTIPNGSLKNAVRQQAHKHGYTEGDLLAYCPLGDGCPHCGPVPAPGSPDE